MVNIAARRLLLDRSDEVNANVWHAIQPPDPDAPDVTAMETHSEWDQLVNALREELQEKGGLLQFLNQQTEVLYLRLPDENRRLEEQIRTQILVASGCTRKRELILREIASRMDLADGNNPSEIVVRFPEYVQPLLEALFSEVERLSGRMEERLRQNQQLKTHFFSESASAV